jgi:hypothetical protein
VGYPPKSVYLRLLGSYEMLRTSEKSIQAKFAEFSVDEVRRIPLLGTWVNRA